MNTRNESRSGSLFFGLKANKGSIKQMFVSGPPEQMFAFRSWSWTRPDQLWELCDTPGCVVRTGVRRRRHARIRWSRSWSCERANKWLCENLFVFFIFFHFHYITDQVPLSSVFWKIFLKNFLFFY